MAALLPAGPKPPLSPAAVRLLASKKALQEKASGWKPSSCPALPEQAMHVVLLPPGQSMLVLLPEHSTPELLPQLLPLPQPLLLWFVQGSRLLIREGAGAKLGQEEEQVGFAAHGTSTVSRAMRPCTGPAHQPTGVDCPSHLYWKCKR